MITIKILENFDTKEEVESFVLDVMNLANDNGCAFDTVFRDGECIFRHNVGFLGKGKYNG